MQGLKAHSGDWDSCRSSRVCVSTTSGFVVKLMTFSRLQGLSECEGSVLMASGAICKCDNKDVCSQLIRQDPD